MPGGRRLRGWMPVVVISTALCGGFFGYAEQILPAATGSGLKKMAPRASEPMPAASEPTPAEKIAHDTGFPMTPPGDDDAMGVGNPGVFPALATAR